MYTFYKPIIGKYVSFGAVFRNCWAITSNGICLVLVIYYKLYQTHYGTVTLGPKFQFNSCPRLAGYIPKYHDYMQVICKSSLLQTPNHTSVLVGCGNRSEDGGC